MKEVFIADLKKDEMLQKNVTLLAFVSSVSDQSNGKKKYEFKLTDKTGHMVGVVWEDGCKEELLTLTDRVIAIEGTVGKYHGFQITMNNISVVSKFEPLDYSPSVENPQEQFNEFVDCYHKLIERPNMIALVDYFYMDQKATKKFSFLQGGKEIHHAYIGGYISHLSEVLEDCRHDVEKRGSLTTGFDADAVFTAACLHDVGKIKEYTLFPYNKITLEGYMVGHLNLSLCMVYMAIYKLKEQGINFSKDEELKILHCIATSHSYADDGLLENQRIKPMCLEAIILAKSDTASAKYAGVARYINSDLGNPDNEDLTRFSPLYKQFFYKG